MTIEEGESGPNQVKFRLQRIGRISFSHDSAVRIVSREKKEEKEKTRSRVQNQTML